MPAYAPRNSEANFVALETPVNAQVITATGNFSAGGGWSQVRNARFQAVLSSVTGTTPSYTINVQDSIDGTNWVTVGSFTAITANGSQSLTIQAPLSDNVRFNIVVTGTTPSANVTILAQSVAWANVPA